LLHFFRSYFKSFEKIVQTRAYVARYFIISGVPFVFNFLKENVEKIKFGDFDAYIGFFQTPHAAAIVTAISTAIIIFDLLTKKYQWIAFLADLSLACFGTYLVYATFIRTGYVVFLAIICTVMALSLKNFKSTALTVLAGVSIMSFAFYELEYNDSFRDRIFDENQGSTQVHVASGRLEFGRDALVYWQNLSVAEKFAGSGMENLKDYIYASYGIWITSHNGFIDALVINGILGEFLILIYCTSLIIFVFRRKSSPEFPLALGSVFAFTSVQLTQGGAGFSFDLMLALTLTSLEIGYYTRLNEVWSFDR